MQKKMVFKSSGATRRALCAITVVNKTDTVNRKLSLVSIRVEKFAANITEDLPDDNLKGFVNVGSVKSRCLHEEQPFFLRESFPFFHTHSSYILQITLVAN